MNKHDWVDEVLADLEVYIQAHGAVASRAALDFARYVTAQELGLSRDRPERRAPQSDFHFPPRTIDMFRCRLVVDNVDP